MLEPMADKSSVGPNRREISARLVWTIVVMIAAIIAVDAFSCFSSLGLNF